MYDICCQSDYSINQKTSFFNCIQYHCVRNVREILLTIVLYVVRSLSDRTQTRSPEGLPVGRQRTLGKVFFFFFFFTPKQVLALNVGTASWVI